MIGLDLQDGRDIVIIAAGGLMVLVLLAILVFTVVLGLGARALLGAVRSTLKDDVSPLFDSAHQTVRTVRGTAVFVSETAVSPVIRVYSIAAGARRAVGVLAGITGRRGAKGEE